MTEQEETFDEEYYKQLFQKVDEFKAEGNKLFKSEEYQKAIISYAKAQQELDSKKFLNCKFKDYIKLYVSTSNLIYGNVSLCYFKKENYVDSKMFSEKIILTDPLNFKAYFRLAQIARIQKNKDEALQNIEAAIEIGSDPKYKISNEQMKICLNEKKEIQKI